MTITRRGIVATSQTLASQAGAQVLARGGSAADAAIAANAALAVVEPMMNGIGGDLFVLVRDAAHGTLTGLNASGPAPAGLSIDYMKKRGHTAMPATGIHSVTVPGCVRGWAALHGRFGKLPWSELFLPAIYYADKGFPVTEVIAADWRAEVKKLEGDATAKQAFLPEGKSPVTGQVFRNPGMATAFRLIAAQGAKAFYEGEIASAILSTSQRLGGTLIRDDLARFEPAWVAPISTTYRGWTVSELPPNSQGIAVLEMLNVFEHFDFPRMGPASPQAWHLKIEAQKVAYADLARYVADPRHAQVPVEGLLSKRYAASRAAAIAADKASCTSHFGEPAMSSQGDTIYMAAIDADGNIVSLIQSIFQAFGSGIAVPGYGFALQNRGASFTLDPAHPNALAPGKRPFHTIIPGLLEKGPLHIGFGIMGGLNQAQAQAQFVSNVVDYGMNIQAALEAPRFTKLTFGGCDVRMEGRVPAATVEALRKMGHQIQLQGDFAPSFMGGGQAVMLDAASGVHYGASSPRKDGSAVPEPDPYFPGALASKK
jgi:gamma-glutamyltranspeptidase / glutathione hydrolase